MLKLAKFSVPLLLAVFSSLSMEAQERSVKVPNSKSDIEPSIALLISLHDQLVGAQDDDLRNQAHSALKTAMASTFLETDFWEVNTDSLAQRIGVVSVGEKQRRVAILTWNVEFKDRTNAYGGVIIHRSKSDEQIVTPLVFKEPNSRRNTLDPKSRFNATNWPGAIYYDILEREYGNRKVYTLLGWNGADGLRNRKIIETMSLSSNRIKFGIPIIDVGRGSVKRYVLEYSDAVSTSLRWREDMQMIVMDHLSPSDETLEGYTAFYGPDFTYDGFAWHRNHWVLKENIEVRDTELNTPWNNPKKRRRRSRN
jgi:hypothetical protein|tara:strand:- start:6963 stop:7892 length:930 start_codon:yes stop_codon:yes gene_type:complete